LWPELVKLTEEVKDGDKILDVGCGNGRLLRAFQGKNISYIGVDNSEKLISLAKRRSCELRIANCEFRIFDILELSKLPQINFDYVFCVAVLQHIPGRDLRIAALKQLKNKVSDDGKIIISVWNLWNQKKFRKLIFKFWALKLIKKNNIAGEAGGMDFGDILFDWKNSRGEAISKRYYHAFRMGELKDIIKKTGLKIEKIYKDKRNYYAVLKK